MYLKSVEIRQAFIDFFTKKGHETVPSSSLVPQNDPSLLFTNSGMVQFKDVFLGIENTSYSRAQSVQKCLRAGGKHNDLENVGFTARHHTFFEMLGNFSFGDYFKREAINFAWEFLTEVLKLPKERLWITVYKDDEQSADIWLNELKVSRERFSYCGDKDNFWSMGETGPCGPCTEIFYDHGKDVAGSPPGTIDEDGDRYVEIWNLVFMQFNKDEFGKLHPLPKPSVDTGMGLERITAVVQGVYNNFDTDLFVDLINAVKKLHDGIDEHSPSLKVIADHIRACSFLIVDGITPSNEGRGYVLRRIIRRAVRHGHKLNIPNPFFYMLVEPLIKIMGKAYPELNENKEHIKKVLIDEEKQFARTIEQGMELLKNEIAKLDSDTLPGEVAFKLYDTYGFPYDLTQDIVRESNLSVNFEDFDKQMQAQRAKSKSASAFQIDYYKTIQINEKSEFLGYEHNETESEVVALICDDREVLSLQKGLKAGVVLKATPFYAESGGQVGDKGQIAIGNNLFKVEDTKQIGNVIVHYGELLSGEIKLKDTVTARVDHVRRDLIRLNHTATHLLHAALKKIIGSNVQQKGSLVDAERARFDFTHKSGLTVEEIIQIETLVNYHIRLNDEVTTEIMDFNQAKKSGAVALFGEKYKEKVRVLTVGEFSKELCGGTHAKRTGDIGLFKIISESGIASGIRRIEFVTGPYALQWVNEQLLTLKGISSKLKVSTPEVLSKIDSLQELTKQQEKELNKLNSQLASKSSQALLNEVRKINDVNLLVKKFDNKTGAELRLLLDQLKSNLNDSIIILYTVKEHTIQVVTGISKGLIGKVPSAVDFVKHLCGKGGGRNDMAQGGGEIPENLAVKLKEIEKML